MGGYVAVTMSCCWIMVTVLGIVAALAAFVYLDWNDFFVG